MLDTATITFDNYLINRRKLTIQIIILVVNDSVAIMGSGHGEDKCCVGDNEN